METLQVNLQGHSKDISHIASEVSDCDMDGVIDDGDLLCLLNNIVYQYGALQTKYNNLVERVDQHNARMGELVKEK